MQKRSIIPESHYRKSSIMNQEQIPASCGPPNPESLQGVAKLLEMTK